MQLFESSPGRKSCIIGRKVALQSGSRLGQVMVENYASVALESGLTIRQSFESSPTSSRKSCIIGRKVALKSGSRLSQVMYLLLSCPLLHLINTLTARPFWPDFKIDLE